MSDSENNKTSSTLSHSTRILLEALDHIPTKEEEEVAEKAYQQFKKYLEKEKETEHPKEQKNVR